MNGCSMRQARWATFGLTAALLCCKREPAPVAAEEKPVAEVLLDPEDRPTGRSRCLPFKAEQPLMIRAEAAAADPDETESPFGVELGSAVAWGDAFAVAFLRPGKVTQARVAITDGKGRSRLVDLGAVHGSVDPPRLVVHGSALLIAMMDSDAAGSTLRIGRIPAPDSDSVAWGPEVSEGRDDSSVFMLSASAGTALLIWDREDSKSAISRVTRMTFDPVTLAVRTAASPVTAESEDADQPLLVQRPGGFWLVWSSYAKRSEDSFAGEADARGLVEAPPAKLRAALLDDKGILSGSPVDLGELRLLGSDGAVAADGSLVLAVQSGDSAEDEQAIRVLRVGLDGQVTRRRTVNPELVAAAPLLLQSASSSELWLTARGKDGTTLLAALASESELRLEPEKELRMKEPLAIGSGGWLVAEPAGADIRLRLFACAETPDAPRPSVNPAGKTPSIPPEGARQR